jgi:isoamylase
LRDLVSYNDKHNEANGEDNRDGANDNNSWNCGAEGPTNDPNIIALRERQMRNLLATLFMSQGVPMICAGDELSHTQQGNNNTYCQDNEITWLNWSLDERRRKFLDFVKEVARIWRENPVFQRRKFLQGRRIRGSGIKDISWFAADGTEMSDEDWNAGFVKCLGVRLAGDLIGEVDEHGETVSGDTMLLLLNAHHEAVAFTLPQTRDEHVWERLFDTADERDGGALPRFTGTAQYRLQGRSVVLFRTRESEGKGMSPSTTQANALKQSVPADRPYVI